MKFIGFGFLLVVVLFSCSEDTSTVERPKYTGPLLISENVDVVFTDSARVKFKMQAAEQIKLQDENEEFPKGIFLEFFDSKEQKESTLISKYGFK